jgi:hypothetical protein
MVVALLVRLGDDTAARHPITSSGSGRGPPGRISGGSRTSPTSGRRPGSATQDDPAGLVSVGTNAVHTPQDEFSGTSWRQVEEATASWVHWFDQERLHARSETFHQSSSSSRTTIQHEGTTIPSRPHHALQKPQADSDRERPCTNPARTSSGEGEVDGSQHRLRFL